MSAPYVEHVFPDRAAWLEGRREGIGGSEAAAVIGLDPWCSPAKLWATKAGIIKDAEQTEAMELGLLLEPVIRNLYSLRCPDRTVVAPAPWTVRRSTAHPFMFYSPDGFVTDNGRGFGVLQCKAVNEYKGHEWDEEPPLHYLVQLQHEMAVEGASWGVLAALIGGRRFRYFEYERHDRLVAKLIEQEAAFVDGVLRRVQPPIDGSKASAEMLRALHPKDDGSVVDLPDEALEWHALREQAIKEVRKWEAQRDEAENKIKAAIGDHEVGMLPGLTAYSWRTETRTYKATEAKTWTGRVLRLRQPK